MSQNELDKFVQMDAFEYFRKRDAIMGWIPENIVGSIVTIATLTNPIDKNKTSTDLFFSPGMDEVGEFVWVENIKLFCHENRNRNPAVIIALSEEQDILLFKLTWV